MKQTGSINRNKHETDSFELIAINMKTDRFN